MDALAPDGGSFLSDLDVEALAVLTPFPDGFEAISGYEDLDLPERWKYPYALPGAVWAVAPEDMLELTWAVLQEIAGEIQPTVSNAIPWVPRGTSNVPVIQNQGVSVLRIQVPFGRRWWISGYAFNLFPSQANELNYYWQLRVDGTDLLNKGVATVQPGRPVQTPDQVTIGRDKEQMFLAGPGSIVEVAVLALNTLGASDNVSAAVFGFLEGC
jgi:hypothetical protein